MPKYRCLGPVRHNGGRYGAGDVLELPDAQGALLVREGSAAAVREDARTAQETRRVPAPLTMDRKARGEAATCAGVKRNGEPCSSVLLLESGYCKAHADQAEAPE